MTYEFLPTTDPERLAIKTPYNALFVAELKRAVSNAKWSEKQGVWLFDAFCKPAAEALAKKYFPVERAVYKITWELHQDFPGPSLDGQPLLNVGRDSYSKNNRTAYPVMFLEASLRTGGSRNNPNISGRLVIQTKTRPNPIIKPEPASIEEIIQ